MKKLTRRGFLAVLALFGCVPWIGGCTVGRPFRGPGFAAGRGVTLAYAGEEVLVVLTHAVLDPRRRDPFDDHVGLVTESLDQGRHPGLVGYSVRKQLWGDQVWTMTVWRDVAAAQGFLSSPVHRTAVQAGAAAIRSLQTRRLWVRREEVPLSWARAEGLLAQEAPGAASAQTRPR